MARLYGKKSSYSTKRHREHTKDRRPGVDVGTVRFMTGLLPRAETFVRAMLSLQLFHLTLQGPDLIAVIIYHLR